MPLLVEEAEAVIFEGGGAALGTVDLEMAAARDVEAEGAGEFVGFGFGLLRGSIPITPCVWYRRSQK